MYFLIQLFVDFSLLPNSKVPQAREMNLDATCTYHKASRNPYLPVNWQKHDWIICKGFTGFCPSWQYFIYFESWKYHKGCSPCQVQHLSSWRNPCFSRQTRQDHWFRMPNPESNIRGNSSASLWCTLSWRQDQTFVEAVWICLYKETRRHYQCPNMTWNSGVWSWLQISLQHRVYLVAAFCFFASHIHCLGCRF